MKKIVEVIMGVGGGCSSQISPKQDYVLNPIKVLQKRGYKAEIWTLQKGDIYFYKGLRVRRFKNTFSLLLNLVLDRDVELVYCQLRSYLPSLLSPFTGKKCILVTQTYEIGSTPFIQKFSVFCMKRFTRIFALTPYERSLYLDKGMKKERVVLFPHAIDYSFFSKRPLNLSKIRSKYGIKKNDFIIVTVANFRKFKNLDIIVDAFGIFNKKIRNSKLVIVGKDQTKNALYREQGGKRYEEVKNVDEVVEKNNLGKNVILAGSLSYKRVKDLLYVSHIFVNSSDPEGMGMAVYEAASAGVPLCLSNIGSFTSVFKENALYNKPRDQRTLADNLMRYYGDKALGNENSNNLKEQMRKYDFKAAAKKFEQIFDELGL